MAIYTGRGDEGETDLLGGQRISKAAPLILAIGDVDELNSALGCMDEALDAATRSLRADIFMAQEHLLRIGALLAGIRSDSPPSAVPMVCPADVGYLETAMDRMGEELPPLKSLLLPRGTRAACAAHLARAVCRRAERNVVAALDVEPAPPGEGFDCIPAYLNRLSDYLFVAARWLNRRSGVEETGWGDSATSSDQNPPAHGQ